MAEAEKVHWSLLNKADADAFRARLEELGPESVRELLYVDGFPTPNHRDIAHEWLKGKK